jgi:signal transduction histidine kinase
MSYKAVFLYLFTCWLSISTGVFAQEQRIADSLTFIYKQNTLVDTAKLELLRQISFHETKDMYKSLAYAEELISLAKQVGNKKYLRMGYFLSGTKHRLLGDLEKALVAHFKSAEIARELNHLTAEGQSYGAVADIYSVAKNHPQATHYYNKAISTLRQANDSISLASALLNAGDEFNNIKRYDSALLRFKEAQVIFEKKNYLSGKGYCLGGLGMVYANVGKNELAEQNINEAIKILEETEDYYPICDYLIAMANIYQTKENHQAALSYASRSLQLAERHELKEQIANAGLKLSELYEKTGDSDQALRYYKMHIDYRDSINNIATERKMADLHYAFGMSQKQADIDKLEQQKKNEQKLTLALGVILGLTIMILAILIRNNQHKQKAYKVLNLQKQEIDKQKAKAEDALSELQVTQKQLIQTAKLASLGELTAGIAHEIQNPLNFVNNFSDVSIELLGELRETTVNKLAGAEKAEANEVINALANNLTKINVHGKRADAIVKGMLQHSRASTGKKEPTAINSLADEYLRLSYHGLRAKDKTFNADFTSDFDESVGKVDVVRQDIGRVLLNLYNNAFYAVWEKKLQENGSFEPHVSVSTRRVGDMVELVVRDNGAGIPPGILDKIFQPFFTTKPSGQGTGLGLSLSYDIIKAHGGELKVETKQGEFTAFIIRLPVGHKNGTFM